MFGTDLNSAFGSYDTPNVMVSPFTPDLPAQIPRTSSEIIHKSTPIVNLAHSSTISQVTHEPTINLNQLTQQSQRQQMQQLQLPQPSNHNVSLQPQGNQDPRIALLINELKKQQMITANIQDQTSYIDRLFSKKKDMLRVFQLSLVVVLGISIHFLIDHYLRDYIKNSDLSFERELLLRVLYPVALLFILWNMKAFSK
jgi:hypothetical protein